MRIIAGKWRSRSLDRPPANVTRPMPDRLKEALFSKLTSYYDRSGGWTGVRVADLFAGSGALGLEALSRGAAACCFYEWDRRALCVLRGNLRALAVRDEGSIVTQNAWRCEAPAVDERPCDLVLLDPPYRDSRDTSETGPVRAYLHRLAVGEKNGPLVVLHHHAKTRFELPEDDPWRVIDVRRYGGGTITLFLR